MMPVVVVGILALAALAYVVAGVVGPADEAGARTSGRHDELERRGRAALVAIIDLEDERDAGKLSSTDFEALVGTYEQEALAAVNALDELERAGADEAVEQEIAAARERLRSASQRPTPPEPGPR